MSGSDPDGRPGNTPRTGVGAAGAGDGGTQTATPPPAVDPVTCAWPGCGTGQTQPPRQAGWVPRASQGRVCNTETSRRCRGPAGDPRPLLGGHSRWAWASGRLCTAACPGAPCGALPPPRPPAPVVLTAAGRGPSTASIWSLHTHARQAHWKPGINTCLARVGGPAPLPGRRKEDPSLSGVSVPSTAIGGRGRGWLV